MTTNFSQTQFSNFLTHLDTKLILGNRSNNILAEILQGRNNYSFLTLCWLCYFSFQRPLQLIVMITHMHSWMEIIEIAFKRFVCMYEGVLLTLISPSSDFVTNNLL